MVMEGREKAMKRIKRIIAVIILCAVVLLVGYSCYTGSQLTGAPKEMYGYKNTTFHTSDGEMVAFTNGYAWYKTEYKVVLLTLESYQDGVIKMTREDEEFYFTAVGKDMIYDEQTQKFLTRSNVDG